MKSVKFTWLRHGPVQVTGTAECGREFEVGLILEPWGENPLLILHNPTGIEGVRQVLDAWEENRPT